MRRCRLRHGAACNPRDIEADRKVAELAGPAAGEPCDDKRIGHFVRRVPQQQRCREKQCEPFNEPPGLSLVFAKVRKFILEGWDAGVEGAVRAGGRLSSSNSAGMQ